MDFGSTAHDDVIYGTVDPDVFRLWKGGNDTVHAHYGDDILRIGHALGAGDVMDGGEGFDTLILKGDYSAGLTFGATTMYNVERLRLLTGSDYDLATNDGNIAAGETLWVNAQQLGATNTVTFDGSAETDGYFKLLGGAGDDGFTGGEQADRISGHAGNDALKGGFGADKLTGGVGDDTFVYGSVDQSKSIAYDTITDVDAAHDKFDVNVAVGFVGTAFGEVNFATLDTDLAARAGDSLSGAMVVTATSGTATGHVFLLVDGNSNSFYNGGLDYLMDITGLTGALTTANFI